MEDASDILPYQRSPSGIEYILFDLIVSLDIISPVSKERSGDFPQLNLSRRQFCKGVLRVFGMGVAAEILRQSGFNWAVDISPARAETQTPYPEPGWLETSLPDRPPFIDTDQGHKEYLRYLCLNHQVLREALRKAYGRIFSEGHPSYPTLGDCLFEHLEYAKGALTTVIHDSDPSLPNIIHVASLTKAAVLSPYFTPKEVMGLGVSIPTTDLVEDNVLFLLEKHKAIPHVFPADPETCQSNIDIIARCDGGDRAVHAAQHEIVAHQASYALTHGLQEVERIPNGAKLLMGLGITKDNKVIVLDWLAQLSWEIKETVLYFQSGESEYGRDEHGNKIPSGLVDRHIGRDFRANMLGLSVGLKLAENPITEDEVRWVIEYLNNPAFYKVR